MPRRSVRWGAVLLLTSACASAPRPAPSTPTHTTTELGRVQQTSRISQGEETRNFLSVQEVFAALEQSPRRYEFKDLASVEGGVPTPLADAVWPRGDAQPLGLPTVSAGPDGSRRITEGTREPRSATTAALLREAEVHFQARRFDEAARAYEQVLQREPDNYLVTLYWGDAALWAGRPDEALRRYEQAGRLNPDDHRSHFFRSSALRHLGRMEDARDAFAWALALRPNHPTLVQALQTNPAALGAEYAGPLLDPKVLVRREGDAFSVYVDGPAWMAYGACKALWLGEPEHRQKLTGSAEPGLTSTEEAECLGVLAQAYLALRGGKQQHEDPQLERLVRILQDGYGSQLIAYELLSRRAPHLTLSMGSELRERMHAFVLRYVMPLKAAGGTDTAAR